MKAISKSKFMSGRQCARRLWQEIHHPEQADDYGLATEFTFFQGHEVGALAQQLRGRGVLIELDRGDIGKALRAYCQQDTLLPTQLLAFLRREFA